MITDAPELDHESPMPFGIHKDKDMGDIPARYFYHLWNDSLHRKTAHTNDHGRVARYINRNLIDLKSEHPKGNWK